MSEGFVLVNVKPAAAMNTTAASAAGRPKPAPLRRANSANLALNYPELRLSSVTFWDGGAAAVASALLSQRLDALVPSSARAGAASRYTFREEGAVLEDVAARRARREQEADEAAQRAKTIAEERQRKEEERKRKADEAFERAMEESSRLAQEEQEKAFEAARLEQERRRTEQERLEQSKAKEEENQQQPQQQQDPGEDDLEGGQRVALQRFLSITGSGQKQSCERLLRAYNFRLEEAVSGYFDAGENTDEAVRRAVSRQAPDHAAAGAAAGKPDGPPQATLEIVLTDGTERTVSFAHSDTLWSVYQYVATNDAAARQRAVRLQQPVPERTFDESDFDLTLQQAGLVPRGKLHAIF